MVGKGAIDITGQWRRYPVYTLGFTDPDNDPNKKRMDKPFVPPRMGEPPLKPAYLKEWKAMQEKAREARAKGQPLNSQVVNCLPEGMPTMMGPTFPMEILQTKGMITIIEEAYTQVRHIYLDQKLPPDDEIDPSFLRNLGGALGQGNSDRHDHRHQGQRQASRRAPFRRHADHREDQAGRARHPVGPDHASPIRNISPNPGPTRTAWTRMKNYKLQEYICEDNREFIDQNGVQQQKITN